MTQLAAYIARLRRSKGEKQKASNLSICYRTQASKSHLSSSELNLCLSDGMVKSKVPFGTGGKLELASKLRFPMWSVFTSSSSSESDVVESSSMKSDTSDDVGSLGSEICSNWRLESGGEIGNGRSWIKHEDVRGGRGGGKFSSSWSLPVAISKLSNSLNVCNRKLIYNLAT